MAQQAEDSQKLDALQASLKAQLSRPPSPPASPRIPSSEVLLQLIQDPLTTAMRRAIQPAVEEVRLHVQKTCDEQSKEIFGTIYEEVKPALVFAEALKSRLPSILEQANPPQP